MISLTILELLYLVLTFFSVVIGTLVVMVLLRVLKILRVGTELADMYFMCKEFLSNLWALPEILKERFVASVSEEEKEESKES